MLTTPKQAGDLSSLARLLFAVPTDRRRAVAIEVCEKAMMAREWRDATLNRHPRWGCGDVMTVARNFELDGKRVSLPPEPDYDNDDYCACTIIALEAFRVLNSIPAKQERAA